MALAIFDLDETLVACDSCSQFCEFMLAEGLVDQLFVERDQQMMVLYNNEQLVLSDYIRFFIEPLRRLSRNQIDELLPRFVEQFIADKIYPQARETLSQMKAEGHRVVIVSATAEFIVRAIANELGVEDVLAINLQTKAGRFTGEIDGVPTFREGKVTRLKEWLVDQNETLEGAYFFSDSINDLPLLEQVENPVVANADSQLQRIAEQRQWSSVNWADAMLTTNSIHTTDTHFTTQEPTHV